MGNKADFILLTDAHKEASILLVIVDLQSISVEEEYTKVETKDEIWEVKETVEQIYTRLENSGWRVAR